MLYTTMEKLETEHNSELPIMAVTTGKTKSDLEVCLVGEDTKLTVYEVESDLDTKSADYYELTDEEGEPVGYLCKHSEVIAVPTTVRLQKVDKLPSGVGILLTIVGVALALFAAMVIHSSNSNSVNPGTQGMAPGMSDIQPGALTGLTIEEKRKLAQDLIDKSLYEIRLNVTPKYEEGKLNLRVENSDMNSISVIITVELQGKEIYRSAVLSPGNSIEYATVNAEIPKGKTPAYVMFNYLDDAGKIYQSSSVNITILN